MEKAFDVLVIGGGMAGLSAGLWCSDLGLSCAVCEARAVGGQLGWIHNPIRNYPGLEAADGREFREKILRQARSAHFELIEAEAEGIDCEAMRVSCSDGTSYAGKALILAMGVRRRELGVEGEREFRGKGILESGSGEREKVKGKDVVVVGGGDAAAENALILSRLAKRVTLVHRRERLTARSEFVEEIRKLGNIELLLGAQVRTFVGSDWLESVEVVRGDSVASVEAQYAVVRIGVAPNSELVAGQVETDASGYVVVDAFCGTSLPGVFAAGDVANPVAPTLVTAGGMGATAAKATLQRVKSGQRI